MPKNHWLRRDCLPAVGGLEKGISKTKNSLAASQTVFLFLSAYENKFSTLPEIKKPHFREAVFAFAVTTRLELATSGVTGRHSNQLNYATF